MLAIVEALSYWQPNLYGEKFVIHTDHWPLVYFLYNRIFPLTNHDGLKILLIFLHSVPSNTPKDLLISFWVQSLNALLFLLPCLWTLPYCISLTWFSLSRCLVFSWRGTGITSIVSMLNTMCWRMTSVTSWLIKGKNTYQRVLPRSSYENIMMRMVISARQIHKSKLQVNHRVIYWSCMIYKIF